MSNIVTTTAPVNIAVVKYWGKRDEDLLLPINGSISGTLDQSHMRAKTTVYAGPELTCDRFWLNKKEQSIDNKRFQNVLNEIRQRVKNLTGENKGKIPANWRVHICSENNFPTAAGLASSAAGYACLAFALAKLYGLEGNVSEIARIGSGSACRSMFGGFVEWQVGTLPDGSDSIAKPIVDEKWWEEMSVLILVVNTTKKHTGSTEGMESSVKTSKLLQFRAEKIVPKVMSEMKRAILAKDFHLFAELTMKDSNQMHAACMDTYPPIFYMTDVSKNIIRLVHYINNYFKKNIVCYTFDAGPNACLYLLKHDVPLVISTVLHFFPPIENSRTDFVTGIDAPIIDLDKVMIKGIDLAIQPGAIQNVISTKIGSAPQILPLSESLISIETGLPK